MEGVIGVDASSVRIEDDGNVVGDFKAVRIDGTGREEYLEGRDFSQAESVVVATPPDRTFNLFAKLPAGLGQKHVDDYVWFDAKQSIPFEMSGVVWKSDLFGAPGSADRTYGISVVTRESIRYLESAMETRKNPRFITTANALEGVIEAPKRDSDVVLFRSDDLNIFLMVRDSDGKYWARAISDEGKGFPALNEEIRKSLSYYSSDNRDEPVVERGYILGSTHQEKSLHDIAMGVSVVSLSLAFPKKP